MPELEPGCVAATGRSVGGCLHAVSLAIVVDHTDMMRARLGRDDDSRFVACFIAHGDPIAGIHIVPFVFDDGFDPSRIACCARTGITVQRIFTAC